MIKNVVAVHRSADGELEDVGLAVDGAPVTQNADWLPAIEQFGEGVFVHFDDSAITEWLGKETLRLRHEKLINGYAFWSGRFIGKAPSYPGSLYE